MLSKPLLSVSGGRNECHVDVDAEQVAHGARVLGAVQALERPPPRVRIQRRGLVDPRFERVHQRAHRGGLGVPRGWRRHHPRPQLPDHLLSGFGVRLDLCRVETGQDEPPGLAAFAVATRAVLRDELILRLDRRPRVVRTGLDVRRRHLDRRLGRPRWLLGGLRGRSTPRSPAAATAKAAFLMIKKYRARRRGIEAFCRLTLSRIVMYWSKADSRKSRAARACYREFTDLFGHRDRMPAHFVRYPISTTGRGSSGRPARSRALHQPRAQLAGVQPARPRSGDLGLSPAARAREVPGDRRLEPRRVLHGAGRHAAEEAARRRGGLSADGLTPSEQLAAVRRRAARLMEDQAACWSRSLRPALEQHGIRFLDPDDYTDPRPALSHQYFRREIFPLLTPLAFDPGHPFPFISNRSRNFAVVVRHQRRTKFARVKVPPTPAALRAAAGRHRVDVDVRVPRGHHPPESRRSVSGRRDRQRAPVPHHSRHGHGDPRGRRRRSAGVGRPQPEAAAPRRAVAARRSKRRCRDACSTPWSRTSRSTRTRHPHSAERLGFSDWIALIAAAAAARSRIRRSRRARSGPLRTTKSSLFDEMRQAGPAGPPSVRLVRRRRSVPGAGRRRPACRRDQDDALPDRRELAADRSC